MIEQCFFYIGGEAPQVGDTVEVVNTGNGCDLPVGTQGIVATVDKFILLEDPKMNFQGYGSYYPSRFKLISRKKRIGF